MNIKFKPEVEAQIKKALKLLNAVGIKTSQPAIYIKTDKYYIMGDELPHMKYTMTGDIEFVVPDKLIELK